MPTLKLHNIQYSQLDSTTWCATAQVPAFCHLNSLHLFSNPLLFNANLLNIDTDKFSHITWHYHISNVSLSARKIAYQQRQQQRAGVRLLLQSLLNKLDINDSLDDVSFPIDLLTVNITCALVILGRVVQILLLSRVEKNLLMG